MQSDSPVFFLCSCKSPVYEVPQGSYTGERILEILLDPDIDQSNVCRSRPVGVTRSSTFVVDLESLEHPEDIKKDEFGKWKYSGSHKKLYAAWQTPQGKLQFERVSHSSSISMNIFELRRVHCTHPSNPHCQRLLAFITGQHKLIQYHPKWRDKEIRNELGKWETALTYL